MSERQGRDLNSGLADAQVHDLSADTWAPMGQVVTPLSAGEERLGSQRALVGPRARRKQVAVNTQPKSLHCSTQSVLLELQLPDYE